MTTAFLGSRVPFGSYDDYPYFVIRCYTHFMNEPIVNFKICSNLDIA
jgi:hypothetical protein